MLYKKGRNGRMEGVETEKDLIDSQWQEITWYAPSCPSGPWSGVVCVARERQHCKLLASRMVSLLRGFFFLVGKHFISISWRHLTLS